MYGMARNEDPSTLDLLLRHLAFPITRVAVPPDGSAYLTAEGVRDASPEELGGSVTFHRLYDLRAYRDANRGAFTEDDRLFFAALGLIRL